MDLELRGRLRNFRLLASNALVPCACLPTFFGVARPSRAAEALEAGANRRNVSSSQARPKDAEFGHDPARACLLREDVALRSAPQQHARLRRGTQRPRIDA